MLGSTSTFGGDRGWVLHSYKNSPKPPPISAKNYRAKHSGSLRSITSTFQVDWAKIAPSVEGQEKNTGRVVPEVSKMLANLFG